MFFEETPECGENGPCRRPSVNTSSLDNQVGRRKVRDRNRRDMSIMKILVVRVQIVSTRNGLYRAFSHIVWQLRRKGNP